MPSLRDRHLVETDWLAEHLDTPDLVIVDGSVHLPTSGRNAKAEYAAQHIPGALFFDVDDIADETSGLPHMMPSTVKFASKMKKLGIGDGTRVVAYDSVGLYSAARVWWMLRAMGHQDVAVLNGGLKKWLAEGRAVTDEQPPPRTQRHFTPRFDASLIRDVDDIKAIVAGGGGEQIIDARSPSRFRGEEAEPRKGLRAGHMPGALNVHYAALTNSDGTLKDEAELAAIFAAAGVDMKRPIATSCGSGITACTLAIGLAMLGRGDVAVYDGSWVEWGDPERGGPVVAG